METHRRLVRVSDAGDGERQPGDQALIFCMSASDTSKLA